MKRAVATAVILVDRRTHSVVKEILVRPAAGLGFWSVTGKVNGTTRQRQSALTGPTTADRVVWMIIYDMEDDESYLSHVQLFSGGLLRCPKDDTILLPLEMNMDLRCSVGELKRKARWFCEVCLHGICIACVRAQREKHKRNVTVTDLEEVVISESSTSPSSSSLYVEIEETEEMSDSLTLEVQLEENGVADEFDVWIEDDGDDFVEVFQAAPDADQEAELEETCLRAESVLVPDYVDGHILLNHYAHVLTRRFRSSLNLKSKRILSSIATSMPGFTSVLNLEGLLFPAIFWSATKTGDVFGGLPVTALAGDLLHEFRLSNLQDTLLTRLNSWDFATAFDESYQSWAFDILYNIYLRRHDSRDVLHLQRNPLSDATQQHVNWAVQEGGLSFDDNDARKNVRRLLAFTKLLSREDDFSYFYTLTCNQRETPGMRRLWNFWTENNLSVEHMCSPAVILWSQVSQLILRCLFYGQDKVFGDVRAHWGRYDFQTMTANLPHIHVLIANGERLVSPAFYNRTTCSLKTVFHICVLNEQIKPSELFSWIERAHTMQVHNCADGRFRCHKETNSGIICRFDRYRTSVNYAFEAKLPNYSQDTLRILSKLGLAALGDDGKVLEMDEYLKGGKWSYPIDDGRVAVNPFNGPAFVFTCSQQNLKRTDGRRWVRSYAANYVAYEEERASLSLSFKRPEPEATVETDGVKNIKIGGVRKYLEGRKKLKGVQCHLICRTDMLWSLHQLPYVLCNAEFVELPTVPQDCRHRYEVKKFKLLRRLQSPLSSDELTELKEELKFADDDTVETVKAVWFAERLKAELYCDESAPADCRMTPSQKDVIMEHVLSPASKDKIQTFGVRHPWLLCLCNPLLYYQFVRVGGVCESAKPYIDRVLDSPISTGFVDGFHNETKLVFRERLRLYLFTGCRLGNGHPFAAYLCSIIRCQTQPTPVLWDFHTAFVVVVPSFVPPKDPVKWLCHMALVGGDFETEKEVLCSSKCGLRSLLDRSKLIGGHTFTDVYNLLERFVSTELMFFGCSRSTFEVYLHNAETILVEVIIHNEVPSLNMATTPSEILEAVAARTEQLSRSVLEPLISDLDLEVPDFPSRGILDQQDSLRRQPVPFNAVITPVFCVDGKRLERLLRDQNVILRDVQDAIRATAESKMQTQDRLPGDTRSYSGTKIFNVLGPPGCGKTVVQRFCAASALAQGLNVLLLTGSSIRAASIGGQHLHKIFPMPVEKSKRATPNSLASSAVNTLSRPHSAHIRNFLLNLDMVIFEEAYAIPAENLLAIKTILEFVKDTHESFGGILVFMSGDNMQATIESRYSVLDAPFILYTAANYMMHEMARSRNDSNLTDLLQRLRGDTSSASVCAQIAAELWRGCSFAASFNDLPPGTPILFGKTSAVNKLTEELRPRQCETWDFPSSDECYREFTWKPAPKSATPLLNRLLQTPQHLIVYTGALVEVTQNVDMTKGLLHGRFATITSVSHDEIRLFMHRPGENLNHLLQSSDTPPHPNPNDAIITKIWSFDVRLSNGAVVRRRQFPIRLAQCGTVHRYQGCEIQRLAMTFPFDDSKEERIYAVWQKNLLISLISRTTSLKNVYIVLRGRSSKVLETRFKRYIATLSGKKMQYDEYVRQLMRNRDRLNPTDAWTGEVHPFKHSLTTPPPHTPVCYIVSSTAASDVYIGQTIDLEQRLLDHQHGRGSRITRASADWKLVAFVHGFTTGQRRLLLLFEEILQQRTGLFSTASLRRSGLLPPIVQLNRVLAQVKRLLRNTVEDFNAGSLTNIGLNRTNGEAFHLWWCMDP